MSDNEVYYSMSGARRDRMFWAIVPGTLEEVRDAATMLYVDMRSRQEEAGNEPTAGVWINSQEFEPTVEELEEFDRRSAAAMEASKVLAEMDDEDELDMDDEPSVEVEDDEEEQIITELPFKFNSDIDLEI